MLDVDIDICKSFHFDNCKSSSVNIKTSKSTHKFIINIESDSLIILSKRLFGLSSDEKFNCEWAAWAYAVAVRELDFHDNIMAKETCHPGDCVLYLLLYSVNL